MINLLNPPQLNSLDDRLDPPLGLMYIAAQIRKDGWHDVKITDLCMVDRTEWGKVIGYADIYGITVFSASLYLAKQIYYIAKKNNPTSLVVVGGPHPTSLPEETCEFFDCVVKGEGEYAFHPFIGANPIMMAPQIENLDELPLPARDLVDIRAYTRKVAGIKATSITASRGCPYVCAFCCKDVFGHKVRYFSIPRVIEEIQSIINCYGIKAFIFYDDTFALDRKRFYPLCEALRKLKIVYRCNGDIRNNTYEDFRVLYDSGCREIAFGVESGSQKILDGINKRTTVEQNKLAIQNAKKAGLITKVFLMVGNPGESAKTIEETKCFMREADPDQYTVFNFVPLPGCDIWKHPDKYGMRIVDWDFKNYYNIAGDNVGGSVVDSETFTTQDLNRWRKELLEALPPQRGVLQDYYEKSTHN